MAEENEYSTNNFQIDYLSNTRSVSEDEEPTPSPCGCVIKAELVENNRYKLILRASSNQSQS